MGRVWVPAAAVVAVTVGGFVLLEPLTSSLQSNEQLPVAPVTVAAPVIPAVTAGQAKSVPVSLPARGARSTAIKVRTKTPAKRETLTYTSSSSSSTTVVVATKKNTASTPSTAKATKKKQSQSRKPVSGDGERNGSSGLADATSNKKLPTVGAQSLAPPR